jgi:hypothetical protein
MRKVICLLAIVSFAQFLRCSKSDPCENVTCENSGYCIDGTCQCVGLWTGENCTDQKTPILITISNVQLVKMPATDSNGAGWDLTSGPDVYIIVKQGGNVLLSTQSNWIQNATAGVSWSTNISIQQATVPISIEVWDYDDFDPDDYMGGITTTIYHSTNKFPTTITTNCAVCTVDFKFSGMTYL